jgi:hypothetical protein
MIAILNFPNHYKGDTFKNKQIIFNFDLTGATIKIKFKLQVNSPVAFSWLTADGTISIIDAVNGRITMNSKIIDVAPATYIFDCQITFADGRVQTYFAGTIIIEQDITK